MLFPFFQDIENEETQEIPLYTEVAWDYRRNVPIMENGAFKKVTGNEAIRVWCYKALQVERFNHIIYTWNYGNELENLIGTPYTRTLAHAEAERYVKECLLINPYITSISNVESSFEDGLLFISCDLNTVYGSTSLEEVRIGV